MRILIAEDEENILLLYRIALEGKGHEILATRDGQECIEEYLKQINKSKGAKDSTPFDAVILDYRMPRMDGLDAAKQILKARPKQRIIFASAFVAETLVDSIKELDHVVELLQKPFEIDVLIDTVEDKTIYEQLQKLSVDIKNLKDWNLTHAQIRDLLDGLMKLRKPGFDFQTVITSEGKAARQVHMGESAN